MTARIRIGMTIQTTSSTLLWLVLEGVGLARALKRKMQNSSRASTNRQMPPVMNNRKS